MKLSPGYWRIALAASIAALIAAPAQAQDAAAGSRPSTVLPTDVVPLPLPSERQALGESLKLRLWQKLPARFYFSTTTETSFRVETNVFQFPTKRTILKEFAPDGFGSLSPEGVIAVGQLVTNASALDVVYRITPNVTAGWSLTPNTRVFVNYFCLRDKLFNNNILNTTINQAGLGIEHQRPIPGPIGKKGGAYELQFTARELWQSGTDPVFDYLPSLTLSYPVARSTIAYFNALMQMRSTKFMCLPNRNITPFYTLGLAHQRGRWSFSANATMLTTFQKGFSESRLDLNTGTWILDFEVARQVIDKIPGFQIFARAEPVYNMLGRNLPGLSGCDFRMYFGARMSAYKPSLLSTMEMLKQHYSPKEQKEPKGKKPKKGAPAEQQPGGEGKKEEKKPETTPGAPVSIEDGTNDLSIITLDPAMTQDNRIAGGAFTYPKTSNGQRILDLATYQAPEALIATPQSLESVSKLNLNSNQVTMETPSKVNPTEASTTKNAVEATPTPAPMHGFLESHKKEQNDHCNKISAAVSTKPLSGARAGGEGGTDLIY